MLHIKANGTIAQLPPERLTLEQMKALVGGYIELVWPMTADGRKICMVVNEEGHCHSLPPNQIGTALYGYAPGVVGDIIVATRAEYNQCLKHPEDTVIPEVEPAQAIELLKAIVTGEYPW